MLQNEVRSGAQSPAGALQPINLDLDFRPLQWRQGCPRHTELFHVLASVCGESFGVGFCVEKFSALSAVNLVAYTPAILGLFKGGFHGRVGADQC